MESKSAKSNTVDVDPKDRVKRGTNKAATPWGPFVLTALRVLDVPLQYILLTRALPSLLNRLGATPIPTSPPVILGLSLHQSILLSMSAGAALKQSHWALAISNEALPNADAVGIAIFNTIMNTANSLLFTWSLTSAADSVSVVLPFANGQELPLSVVVGTSMFVAGLALEWVSEVQRRDFKKDPANQGKCYTGGLFSLARHINYGGYTLWRSGYSLASGGLYWGSFIALLFTSDFLMRGIPILDTYCSKRYGEHWAKYKKEVKWRLLPGLV